MKQPQNYSNHVRYYTAHHFIFYPAMGIAFSICLWLSFKYSYQHFLWVAIALAFLSIAVLSLMLRQHYALGNQNRIVRLEMRLRYYILTHQRLETLEQQLSFNQIAALRFAPDEELPALIELTLKQNLSPGEIKRHIKNWLPDEMRR